VSEVNVANNDESTGKLLGGITGKGFMPGQSGNPSGRPKRKLVDEMLAELLEAADSERARQVAEAILKKATDGDTKAAQLVAERTQGKPSQKVEVTGADGGPVQGEFTIKFVKAE
jgi:hypothetical protein